MLPGRSRRHRSSTRTSRRSALASQISVHMAPLPVPRQMSLEVVMVEEATPSVRRIVFAGEALRGFVYAPGQDVMLSLGAAANGAVKRRYSIRRVNAAAATLEINVVVSGSGPGATWANRVQAGDIVAEVVAPRGKITVDARAPWHLFVGDDTAVPAMLNMTESLPQGAPAWQIFEVDSKADEVPVESRPEGSVSWLHRRGRSPGYGAGLLQALARFPIPSGPGHAYLAGEAQTVLSMRDLLVARGVPRNQLSVKAYWRMDAANLDRGEPQSLE